MPDTLLDPGTPFAVVAPATIARNVGRLHTRLGDVPLRLHVKTAKSVDVAALVFPSGSGPIAVSTLAEAEAFADAGYTDILYAVGIDPAKLDRVLALRRRGVDLVVLLDEVAQAERLGAASRTAGHRIPALIEVDCDGHRGGVLPDSDALLEVASALEPDGELRGVLTHAGESYFAPDDQAMQTAAAQERRAAVHAAERLRAAGFTAPVVSVGSTPTAHVRGDLDGATEVRAGNFVFFDLVMAGVGACDIDDLALSVVVTVIGHRRDKNTIITDGGWMAMSRDRGTARQRVDQGYGLVRALDGTPTPLVMTEASQEHGTLTTRDGSPVPEIGLGTRLRVLPNHACATAAQHLRYAVCDDDGVITATWARITGW